MTPSLDEKERRDNAAKKYWDKFTDKQRWDVYGDFKAGWDARSEEISRLKEQLEIARVALAKIGDGK